MSGRTPAAEDPEVSRRLAELRTERTRNLSCTCRRSADGTAMDTAECPVHGGKAVAALVCGFTVPLSADMDGAA